jgi:predicted PurR-regulated permease PerM
MPRGLKDQLLFKSSQSPKHKNGKQMNASTNIPADKAFLSNTMTAFFQISVIVILLFLCFKIISPFLNLVIWGMIISVTCYPAHLNLTRRLNGRGKLSAVILVVLGIAIIIVPTYMLAESTLSGVQQLAIDFQNGVVKIPPPTEKVRQWPLIGEKVHSIWSSSAANLQVTFNEFAPQIKSFGRTLLAFFSSGLIAIVQLIFSIIIAGALLSFGPRGYELTKTFISSLSTAEQGEVLLNLSIATIRSVVKGVLGVALIQAFFTTLGLLVMGVPAPGLWAGAALVVCIVQLPLILVLGPIALWVFSVADPLSASLFLVYSLIVSVSDTFLKPFLLGRGMSVPMLVILIGAIGGALTLGVVGLFIGAVVLALSYQLLNSWMAPQQQKTL